MAENSDGSIILSVKIDDSGIKPQLNKLKSEIEDIAKRTDKVASDFSKVNARLAKAEILNEKLKQAQEKTAQSVEKTYQSIEKTNQEKLKTSQLDDKAILSAEKVAQAELKTAQQQEKLNAEKAKAAQQSAKQAQEEAKVYNEVFKASSAREKANQAAEKTLQTVEKTKQAEEITRQAFEKTAQSQQKTTQETEKTKQSQEKTKQAVEKTKQAQNKTTEAINKSKKATDTWKSATENITSALGKMARNLGIVFGIRELLRFSNEASKLASQTEAHLKRLGTLYGEAAQEVYDFADANAYAFGMSKTAAYEAAADYGNIFTTFADGAESAKLTNEMLQATAVIASQTGRTYEDVFEKIRSGLYGQTRAIDDLGVSVRKSQLVQTQAFQTVTGGVKKWNDLTDAELQQIRALAIVEQAQQHYGDTVLQSTALTRSQLNAAWQDFKATWGQAVNLILMPMFQAATQLLNTISSALSKLAEMFGVQTKLSDSVETSVGNQKDFTDEINNSVKAQKKLIAGFDDLEILSRDKSEKADDFGGISISGEGNNDQSILDKGQYETKLSVIGAIAGFALVGLGIILLLNAPPKYKLVGLAMVAAGALEAWGTLEQAKQALGDEEKKKLAKIGTFIGTALIGIGVLLLFTKKFWKYGLWAIAMGAQVTYSALSLGDFSQDLKTKASEILIIAGLVAVILGVILLLVNAKGMWKYGLGLIVSGIAEVVIAYEFGGDELKKELETFIVKYWEIIFALSTLMVVVGIFLLFTKAKGIWKYGLALIVGGIATLVTTYTLGGDELKKELETFAVTYWKEIYILAILMVIVGIILLFSKQFKYGITLLVAGIATAAAETAFGGTALKNEVSKFCDTYWKEIYAISTLMVIVGIILCFTPAILYGVTMIVAGISAVVTTTSLSFETIKAELLKMCDDFKTWFESYDTLIAILGIILIFVPGQFQKGIGMLSFAANSIVKSAGKKDIDATYLKNRLKSQLEAVYDHIKGTVDKITGKIGEINESVTHIGSSGTTHGGRSGYVTSIPNLSTQSIMSGGSSIQLSGLARGAVLPANRPFLAVVGDQKKGTNVEAPAELIKQMAMEAIVEAQGSLQGQQTVKEEHYYLNQTELMSVLYKLVKGGERIQGNSLVKQGGI